MTEKEEALRLVERLRINYANPQTEADWRWLVSDRQEAANMIERLARQSAPQQEPVTFDMVTAMQEAQKIVESKILWRHFIDGTPLSNDIAVWMAEFARCHAPPPAQSIPEGWLDLVNDLLHYFENPMHEFSAEQEDRLISRLRGTLAAAPLSGVKSDDQTKPWDGGGPFGNGSQG